MVSVHDLAAQVVSGQSIYVAGGLTPPEAFVAALQEDPERTRDVRITTSVAPGFPNPFDFERLHATATVSGPLALPQFSAAQREGRFRMLPVTFTGFLRHLDTQDFDLGVIQVAPPDASGRYPLGHSVEFIPAALRRCRRIVAVVNPRLLALPFAESIEAHRIDAACEVESAAPRYEMPIDEASDAIGRLIGSIIEDGSTLQMGLGKVPAAIAKALRNHRKLKIHSGMVSDGLRELAQAGALDEDAISLTTVVAGSQALYDWLPQARALRIVGCDQTHASASLARLERFVAVNSALEVDLFGQCNLEHQSGRCVSGAGGAPDFARAARTSRGGLSVVALNATYGKDAISRIVPALGETAMTSLSRLDVDVVVTEFGAADLRSASVHERAQALIGVAAPQHRAALERAWSERARTL
jgi:acyl-CoA hydrolase